MILVLRRIGSPAAFGAALRTALRFAAAVLVLCGLAGATVHVHHGAGADTCAVCSLARTPAATTAVVALPAPPQPTARILTEPTLESLPAPCAAPTRSRAPPLDPTLA